jgi:hypothetical protein
MEPQGLGIDDEGDRGLPEPVQEGRIAGRERRLDDCPVEGKPWVEEGSGGEGLLEDPGLVDVRPGPERQALKDP